MGRKNFANFVGKDREAAAAVREEERRVHTYNRKNKRASDFEKERKGLLKKKEGEDCVVRT